MNPNKTVITRIVLEREKVLSQQDADDQIEESLASLHITNLFLYCFKFNLRTRIPNKYLA